MASIKVVQEVLNLNNILFLVRGINYQPFLVQARLDATDGLTLYFYCHHHCSVS
ncbi:hypothetical protein Lalb_Chr14g0361771 [Lupinus albus]|uniref:Uncharacterized protein n=1 Tax=Lupinus albus TaxID=3870 RepID=A0A6A4PB05_LUPAL|nr:hypothetical protein Lalb_Chr14g0361771 [Lupinus albus]